MAKILFIAANPADTERLRLDDEFREIDLALLATDPSNEDFSIVQSWGVRPRDLSTLLLRHRPDIVHFSGHGSEEKGIVFIDETDRSFPVSGDVLKQLFSILQDNVRCVVLNACFSDAQAQSIREVVEVVVGMKGSVEDKSAIRFASTFYKALGHGKDVQTAFDLAKLEVTLIDKSRNASTKGDRDLDVDDAVKEGQSEEDVAKEREPKILIRPGIDATGVRIAAARVRGSGLALPNAAKASAPLAPEPRSGLLESARIQSYVELVRHLKPLARYDRPGPLTANKLNKISVAMRDWYFDQGGWLYLTDESRAPYFDLKDSLKKAIEVARKDRDSDEALNHMTIAIRHASALRKALRDSFLSSRTPAERQHHSTSQPHLKL